VSEKGYEEAKQYIKQHKKKGKTASKVIKCVQFTRKYIVKASTQSEARDFAETHLAGPGENVVAVKQRGGREYPPFNEWVVEVGRLE